MNGILKAFDEAAAKVKEHFSGADANERLRATIALTESTSRANREDENQKRFEAMATAQRLAPMVGNVGLPPMQAEQTAAQQSVTVKDGKIIGIGSSRG